MLRRLRSALRRNGHYRSLAELSREMGIPYHRLRKAAVQGRLEGYKTGGFWLSTEAAINQAIAEGKIRR